MSTKHNFKVVEDPSREYDDYWKVMGFLTKSPISRFNQSNIIIEDEDMVGTDNVLIATNIFDKDGTQTVIINAGDMNSDNRRTRALLRTLASQKQIDTKFAEFEDSMVSK